jgi:hypothetical protein
MNGMGEPFKNNEKVSERPAFQKQYKVFEWKLTNYSISWQCGVMAVHYQNFVLTSSAILARDLKVRLF